MPPAASDAAFAVAFTHRLRFTRDVLDPANPVLSEVLAPAEGSPGKLLVFADEAVLQNWPTIAPRLEKHLAANLPWMTLAGEVTSVPGGEQAKNDWSVFEQVARMICESSICRHSFVMAIGGGAVLDAVGFAAATAHRGVRTLRLPTTTLAQGDGGIGVKNAINAFGHKNFFGTFAVPWAVINDEQFLSTLSDRDWRSGISEAVKVALLKDSAFFDYIEQIAGQLARRDETALRPIVRRSAELHFQHIANGGDPFELGSHRPLDFGHWSAHKLEALTSNRVRHGEAVAIGIALDSLYAARIGLLPEQDAIRAVNTLRIIGFDLYDDALTDTSLFEGLEEFREHLGGRLTITLPDGIGRQVDVHEVERDEMLAAIDWLKSLVESRRSRTA
jgi:3-dehydroquinate synthase